MGAALRNPTERAFTVPEVSAILGVPQQTVNNALDRELRSFCVARTGHGRRTVTDSGLLAVELLCAFADLFAPRFRREVIAQAIRTLSEGGHRVQIGCVVVNITKSREKVNQGKARLQEAEAMVKSRPEILSGEPCIKGTRVPVYLVGALARKHGIEKARETYPFITRRQVELALVYVEAHPRKGRPPHTLLPKALSGAQRLLVKKVQM